MSLLLLTPIQKSYSFHIVTHVFSIGFKPVDLLFLTYQRLDLLGSLRDLHDGYRRPGTGVIKKPV